MQIRPSPANNHARLFAAALTLTAALIGFTVAYGLFGHAVMGSIYDGSLLPALKRAFAGGQSLDFYIAKADRFVGAWASIGLAFCLTVLIYLRRLEQPASGPYTPASIGLLLGYCLIGLLYIKLFGYEGEWYRLGQIMQGEGTPPFQHRVLLVGVAHQLMKLVPGMSIPDAHLLSQLLALILAFIAVQLLCSLFIRRDLSFVGAFLVLLAWAPTVTYYTFYDIGIMAVFALALYLMFTERFGAYLLVLAVGTYNHEITLFLIVAFAFFGIERMPLRRLAFLLATQLLIYALVRWSLFAALPMKAAWESGKIAKNSAMLLHDPGRVISNLGPVALLYAAGLAAWSRVPVPLRRATIILPCLVFMTFVVGQLNESRQFNAFVPVFAGMVCAWLGTRPGAAPAQTPPMA